MTWKGEFEKLSNSEKLSKDDSLMKSKGGRH